MALLYTKKPGTYVIGSDTAEATLSADYADNALGITGLNASQLMLYVAYTPADNGRSLFIQMEGGPEPSDLYKFMYTDLSTGVEKADFKITQFPLTTVTVAETTYKKRFSEPIADQYLRLSFKEDGTGDFGTLIARVSLYSIS